MRSPSGATCASSRTRARDRHVVEGQGARELRRHLRMELPSEQEHDDDRRRGAGLGDEREPPPSRRCASTASAALPDGTRDVRDRGRQVQPERRRRRSRTAPAARRSEFNANDGARRTVLRALSYRSAVRAVLPRIPRRRWPQLAHVRPAPAAARASISRQRFREAMEARGIGVGVSRGGPPCSTAYRRFGYHRRRPAARGAIAVTTVTLPLFPTMELDADVDRVCEACDEVIRPPKSAHR